MKLRLAFLVGILLQLAAIFVLFLPQVYLQATGEPIRLKTVPVDPWSVFRGEYVTLSYEAGEDLPLSSYMDGRQVYVVLKDSGEGFYERVRYADEKPVLAEGEVCLVGRTEWGRASFPDIGQYFVEEGLAQAFQDAAFSRRLYVDVVVNSSCHALIRDVVVSAEAVQNMFADPSLVMPPPLDAESSDPKVR